MRNLYTSFLLGHSNCFQINRWDSVLFILQALMKHVKSSMPGMKTAIASLSAEADAIESAASSAQSSAALPTSTSKMANSVHHYQITSKNSLFFSWG